MPRFFVSESDIKTTSDGAKRIAITGDDARHVSGALRMNTGDSITVCDGGGIEYECIIKDIADAVWLEVVSSKASENEPPFKAVVYQALVKGDKFDSVVQKAVECGACAIVPFASSRCIAKLDSKNVSKKILRWQKIALEAAKQCGRGIIPTVSPPLDFDAAISEASKASLPLFCYEESSEAVKSFCGAPVRNISIVIGPEGGFSKTEASFAQGQGMKVCSLGRRILRAETAAQFLLSCLCYEYDM